MKILVGFVGYVGSDSEYRLVKGASRRLYICEGFSGLNCKLWNTV